MSEMTNIEELKKRKEQLLLEQEVARLERKQNMGKAGGWPWFWVGPLAVVGILALIAGLDDGQAGGIVVGLGLMAPAAMKLFFKRSSE